MSVEAAAAAWTRRGKLFIDERMSADGLAHGVTSRALGSMKAAENREAALAEAGLGGRALYFCRQVHGTKVVRVTSTTPVHEHPEADGLMTDRSDACLGVFMADCVPLFLWAPGGPFGVFHSGWKGTALGMPRAAVEAMTREFGLSPRELKASIGAHIGACCYQVREDVFSRFPSRALSRRGESTHLDLTAEATAQLREAGVAAGAIGASKDCTRCGADDYFSFRRDKAGNSLFAFAGREPGRAGSGRA